MNKYYNGQGERSSFPVKLPTIYHKRLTEPRGYLATPELAAAVDTAITLGMPLLLTGDPGSGKSSIAKSIAWEVLGEKEEPLSFTIKSDTRATDLFYRFDSVGRFHAVEIQGDISPHKFITFSALGKAILQALPIEDVEKLLQEDKYVSKVHNGTQKRSVVLIDEIDKAPRDMPNDILVEIESLSFDIPEMDAHVTLEEKIKGDESKSEVHRKYQPIIIITSNSERALPEAFLRRCVFHHIQFPPFYGDRNMSGVTVNKIVKSRIGERFKGGSEQLDQAISWFKYLRRKDHGIERKPSLAELLNWLEYLSESTSSNERLDKELLYDSTNNLLLKNVLDQEQCNEWLEAWQEKKTN